MTQEIAGKFGKNSRYAQSSVARRTGPDGVEQRYLCRRFLPEPKAQPLGFHSVTEGDRADLIAASTLGNPGLWWRIADTNLVIDPNELTATIGRVLRIAIEEDVPQDRGEDGEAS